MFKMHFRYFRNDSGKVVAEMEIIFGQNAKMELFMTLYQALYRNGSLGEFSVEPIWDNSKSIAIQLKVQWNLFNTDSKEQK